MCADVDQAEELEEDAVVGHGVEDSGKREHRSQKTETYITLAHSITLTSPSHLAYNHTP